MASILSQDKGHETLASGPSLLSVEQTIGDLKKVWERGEWHDPPTPLIGQPAPSLFRPITQLVVMKTPVRH